MSEVQIINTIDDLHKFLNDNGLLEIAIRGKNKKFAEFQKIALQDLQQSELKEKLNEAIAQINKNNNLINKNMLTIENIAKLNQFSMVLNGLNLFATCIGFAIMNKKLDDMGSKVLKVVELQKKTEWINIKSEFEGIRSEYSNMLDCRKRQKYYSEEQLRKLVSSEYEILNKVTDVYCNDVSDNQGDLLFTMLSLASMLAVSLKYYDETYYFSNKDSIKTGDYWHSDHKKWTEIYNRLLSPSIVNKIQDYGIFDLGLNTTETDCFYISFIDQIKDLKQDIEDNQKFISAINDADLLRVVTEQTDEEITKDIKAAMEKVNVPLAAYEKTLAQALA